MTSTEKAIDALFDELSANLTGLRPEYRDQVLCPLCLGRFGRNAITDKSPCGLSIEHVIPSSVGGQLKTLTCRACNNDNGSALDAHFAGMVGIEDWAQGDRSELKGTVAVGGIPLPMRISRDPNGLSSIRIVGGKPAALEKFKETIAALGDGDKVQLNFSVHYAELPARQALVRIAYLGMFSRLGYRFVLSDAGAFTRGVLEGREIETVRMLTPQISNVETENVDNDFVMTPIGDVAYFNLVRTHTLRERHYAVILPSPEIVTDEIAQCLVKIAEMLDGKQCKISDIKTAR